MAERISILGDMNQTQNKMNTLKQRQEFQVGNEVTFDSYGKPLKAIVKAVTRFNSLGRKDGRVFYKLSGDEIISETTGGSIMESRYFTPWTKAREATFFKV